MLLVVRSVTLKTHSTESCEQYGDPFDTQMNVQFLDPVTVNICDFSGTHNRKVRREIKKFMLENSIKKVTYDRIKDGVKRHYEVCQ